MALYWGRGGARAQLGTRLSAVQVAKGTLFRDCPNAASLLACLEVLGTLEEASAEADVSLELHLAAMSVVDAAFHSLGGCRSILVLLLQEGQQGAAKLQAACADLAEARRAREAADEKAAAAEARSRDLYDSNARLEAHIAGEAPWCTSACV